MKQLILLRHAKSSWNFPELDDYDRPLNDRGKQATITMGERLLAQKISPDLVLSSGAKRAYSTAKRVCEVINYPKLKIQREELLYMSSLSTFFSVVHEISNEQQVVMIVSHNPGISEFANHLLKEGSVEMSTTAVVCINFEIDNWKKLSSKSGSLRYYSYPKASE